MTQKYDEKAIYGQAPVSYQLLLFGLTQQFLEVFERGVGGRWFFLAILILKRQPFGVQVAGVLIVVAVDTQQLPVAAVGRIVQVIMVFVMDRQLTQFFTGKITAAFCADPREDLQRPFSVLYFFHSFFLTRLGTNLATSLFRGTTRATLISARQIKASTFAALARSKPLRKG